MPETRPPWVLVAGDFRENGGMDKANLALAEYLAARGTPLHLVCHSADATLSANPLVTVHHVGKPAGSYFLGSPLLDRKARKVFAELSRQFKGVRSVTNGGNCMLGDVNWSHYVHAAWKPASAGAPWFFRARRELEHWVECRREKRAYRNARLIVTNSEATAGHVRRCLQGGPGPEIRTVYLGIAPQLRPVTAIERARARQSQGLDPEGRSAIFVGALGLDGRKNFDLVVDAWELLCRDASWDVNLLVAGDGPALPHWEKELARRNLAGRIRLLGFRSDVPQLLAASDVLVSVSRYEPYGLNVQEALSRGIGVITTAGAGVAERFPEEMRPLLVAEPASAAGLAGRLLLWRKDPELWRGRCAGLGRALHRTWEETAAEMVRAIDSMAAGGRAREESGALARA